MSEIFLDTETTGLSFKEGHKVVAKKIISIL